MKGRVLVIDDEPEIRRNLIFGLTQEDYAVVACPDGISAIHELNHAREQGLGYQYLVTDVFMPDIDGMKILRVIKSEYPDLPVVVITAFGDESLKFSALSEHNTEYLDKPFEIPDLVAALDRLSAGATTLDGTSVEIPSDMRESVSAYLTLRILDPDRSLSIFQQLSHMEGIVTCHAVRGEVDLILLAQTGSTADMQALFDRVRAMPGVDVASTSAIERPKLDRDVGEFVEVYRKAVKGGSAISGPPGAMSYVIVDIDRGAIQQIFTTVFFIDEVLFCDVIDDSSRLVGIITGQSAVGRAPRIIEKIKEIDGVLRVREARIIQLVDD